MGRPRKTGLDYFPHDVMASNDTKIQAMQNLYGNDGYAFYFKILEMIYSGEMPEKPRNNPGITAEKFGLCIKDKIIRRVVRNKIGLEVGLFDEMAMTACKIGLFDEREYKKSQVLTSNGIKARLRHIQKERGRKRAKPRRNSGKTPEKPPKEKKSKVNKNILSEIEKKNKKSLKEFAHAED